VKIYKIDTPLEKKELLKRLECDKSGAAIMSKKMETLLFVIKDMPAGAANILKQDALALGAELAVPTGVVTCSRSRYDAVLMGTQRQLEYLAKKEKAQPFGLKKLAETLVSFLRESQRTTRIMGIVNANDDSFYPGSRYRERKAVEAIERMIEEGAEIIDIGAVSSRPGSEPVGADEELRRLMPIVDTIKREKLTDRARFSIDSYTPEAVAYALEKGFSVVNDITGLRDERLGTLAKSYGAAYIIMHMQGTPQTMQKNPHYDHVILDIDRFFEERIERAEKIGLRREEIILDVGIGFGKTLEHNLMLLKHLKHFTRFGCEVLIGASRKSMIHKIDPAPVEERLPGTLAIHLEAIRRGASIVRCHDVREHRQAIRVFEAVEKGEIL
jgi:dihydropteroate synthase